MLEHMLITSHMPVDRTCNCSCIGWQGDSVNCVYPLIPVTANIRLFVLCFWAQVSYVWPAYHMVTVLVLHHIVWSWVTYWPTGHQILEPTPTLCPYWREREQQKVQVLTFFFNLSLTLKRVECLCVPLSISFSFSFSYIYFIRLSLFIDPTQPLPPSQLFGLWMSYPHD